MCFSLTVCFSLRQGPSHPVHAGGETWVVVVVVARMLGHRTVADKSLTWRTELRQRDDVVAHRADDQQRADRNPGRPHQIWIHAAPHAGGRQSSGCTMLSVNGFHAYMAMMSHTQATPQQAHSYNQQGLQGSHTEHSRWVTGQPTHTCNARMYRAVSAGRESRCLITHQSKAYTPCWEVASFFFTPLEQAVHA